MNKTFRSTAALGAAIVGILAGSATLVGCSQPDATATSDQKNACGGPNGCGGKDHEKNKCGGANGCGATEKGHEANKCGGPNGCNGAEKPATPAK